MGGNPNSGGIIVGPYDQALIAENSIRGYDSGIWVYGQPEFDGAEGSFLSYLHGKDSGGLTVFNNSIPGRFDYYGDDLTSYGGLTSYNYFAIRINYGGEGGFYTTQPFDNGEYYGHGPLNASGQLVGHRRAGRDSAAHGLIARRPASAPPARQSTTTIPTLKRKAFAPRPSDNWVTNVVDFNPYLDSGSSTFNSYVPLDTGGNLDIFALMSGVPNISGLGLEHLGFVGFQGDFSTVHTTVLGAQTPINIERPSAC